MAHHLSSEGVHPALVLCSSARRARETLNALQPALGPDADVRVESDLYGAGADQLLARLRTIRGHVDSVLLVGHNPAVQDLAISLAGDGDDLALEQVRTKFPTAALATFDLGSTGWARLAPGCAYLAKMVIPRELRDPGAK
jgi:phosphohistidine phosphatase